MKVKIKLKPCPFCGNTKLTVGSSAVIREDNDYDNYAVCCDYNKGGCGACSGYQLSRYEAVKLWNERV